MHKNLKLPMLFWVCLSAGLPSLTRAQHALPEVAAAPSPATVIRAVRFVGNTRLPTGVLDEIAQPFLGRPVVAAEIERLRLELTQAYIRRGFVNSGVLLAADNTGDTLSFRVVEGQIEGVNIRGLQRLAPGYLTQRLTQPDEVLNMEILQDRMQQVLNDPLLARLNIRVLPGSAPGKALLDIDAAEGPAQQWAIQANNYQSPSIGAVAGNLLGEVRNLTRHGDTLALGLTGSEGGYGFGVGWHMPLTPRWAFRTRFDRSQSVVVEEPVSDLDVKGRSRSWELGIDYSPLHTARERLTLGLGVSRRESWTHLLGVPFAFSAGSPDGHNQVTALRFAQEYNQRLEQVAYVLRSTFTIGESNVPDVDAAINMPDRNYWTWLGQGQAVFRIQDRGSLVLRGLLQHTHQHVLSLEQLALGGAASVRGYRENQLVRDRGWQTSIEYRYRVFNDPDSAWQVTLYPFIDHGVAKNKAEKADTLSSFGFGINTSYRAFDADLMLALARKKPPVETQDALQDKGIHFQLRYRFF